MDRVSIFHKIKDVINRNSIQFHGIDFLDSFITPLNIYSLALFDNTSNNHSKYFKDLTLAEKVKILPNKIVTRIINPIKSKLVVIKSKNKITNSILNNSFLFIPTELNHLDQMLPISDELKRSGEKYIYISNKVGVIERFKKLSKEKIFFNDHSAIDLNVNEKERMNAISIETRKLVHLFEKDFGIDHAKKIVSFLEERIEIFFKLVLFYEKLALTGQFKGVVIGNDLSVDGRIMSKVLKNNRIPSICVMHGSVSGEPLDSQHLTEMFIVYGQASYESLIKIGNSPEKLFIGGAPYLDAIHKKLSKGNIHSKITSKLQITNNRPYILVALSGPGHCTTFEHFNKIVQAIFKFAYNNQDFQFVFKLHPKDELSNYSEHVEKWKIPNIKIAEHNSKGLPGNIFDWIAGCDALITGESTVAIEAMLLEKLVLTVDFNNEYKDVDFIDEGCTIRINSENELFTALGSIKSNQSIFKEIQLNSKAYINKYFANVGTAAATISQKIIEKCAE